MRMSSIMRRRSGEIFSGESFMALLRLPDETDCLTVHHTKQNLRPQPPLGPSTKLPLPRERFSPPAHFCPPRAAALWVPDLLEGEVRDGSKQIVRLAVVQSTLL